MRDAIAVSHFATCMSYQRQKNEDSSRGGVGGCGTRNGGKETEEQCRQTTFTVARVVYRNGLGAR